MSRIKSIHINNFKFFDEQPAIDLGETGKHLLLYGENGSGKSSVYWALYTLFECAVKYDKADIEKYFKHQEEHNQSLINIYANKITEENGKEHYNSFIKVNTTDNPALCYEVSLLNTDISGKADAVEVNQASDFINYKVLYKFQDFWNGQPIDLAKIFEGYVLPYVRFSEFSLWRDGTLQPKTSAIEMWQEIQMGPGKFTKPNGDIIQVYKNSKENKQFEKFSKHFDDKFKDLIDFINANAPAMLKKLGYDIDFELKYHEHTHKKGDSKYDCSPFKIDLKITSYLGKVVNIHRPQSFLNEAKITAIAIAIRLTILKKRVNEQAPDVLKFIVFDDVMISLDMNNRDKLIDFLLDEENKFTKDYQLLFLTHDKNLFDFVSFKIKKLHNPSEWVFKEMYAGKDLLSKKEFPIIIDSDLEFIDKAKKYFDAKDYTAASIYIRKELEKIVNERLPAELKYKSDGSFLSLQTLWGNMINRYVALSKPVSEDIKKSFDETKLMVLNPQAHFQNISMPIYKVELEKAFDLIKDIKANYPIPQYTLLLTKGMKLEFKHPNNNYSFEFELLSDFYVDELAGVLTPKFPKCGVIKWQYNGTDFWDFQNNVTKIPASQIEQRLEQIKARHIANVAVPLNIDSEMFDANTKIIDSVWTLKDLIDKAAITI
ncbi:MAG: AAA family ATPase [Candidatus Kapabacteria bacterium]|nr:AAA family ATPase [Candidatus Kapabacteria bacterium]